MIPAINLSEIEDPTDVLESLYHLLDTGQQQKLFLQQETFQIFYDMNPKKHGADPNRGKQFGKTVNSSWKGKRNRLYVSNIVTKNMGVILTQEYFYGILKKYNNMPKIQSSLLHKTKIQIKSMCCQNKSPIWRYIPTKSIPTLIPEENKYFIYKLLAHFVGSSISSGDIWRVNNKQNYDKYAFNLSVPHSTVWGGRHS